jgi:high affinity sulfate transporter 1
VAADDAKADRRIASWLRVYRAADLRPDIIAGLSLAAFVIPESLAYATLAGLQPVAGLYCYLVAGLAYALFGTSRQLAVGPTSALALAVAAGVATLASGDPAHAAELAAAVALLVGLISIGGRYVGLANVAYFLSNPVVTGFKTGAAIYIASTQLPKVLGLHPGAGNFFERIAHVVMSLGEASLPATFVGVAAVALFLGFGRAFPGRPTTLVVVALSIVLASLLDATRFGILLVGDLPRGLPLPSLPDIKVSELGLLIPTAFACFLLAYSEAISVARSFAQKNGYEIDPERELTALGAANVATSLVQGFPVSGGMSQTAVNDLGGARSPLSLVVTSGAVALTLLFFSGLFRNLPEPVLGAIILMAAKHLVKIDELRELWRAARAEFWIAIIALLGVLAAGLLNGLLLAAVGSLILLLARASRPAIVVLARDPASGRYINRDRVAAPQATPGIVVLRSAGSWVYFNAEQIRRHLLELVEQAAQPVVTVVVDFSQVSSVDITAAASLRSLWRTLAARGISLRLAEVRDDVAESLIAEGVEAEIGLIVSHLSVEQCTVTGATASSQPAS